MSLSNASFSDLMQRLGSPSEMNVLAADGLAPPTRPLINAHVHLPPNFTAFTTMRQALDLAARQNVRVLGASNYYDYSVYTGFAEEAARYGIFPLFGLEVICRIDMLGEEGVRINDPGNPGKMYLCGKGISRFSPLPEEARRILQVIRDHDSQRMAAMVAKLAAVFSETGLATGLDARTIRDRVAARYGCPRASVYLQERHIAQAFQEALFERLSIKERAAFLTSSYGTSPKAGLDDAVGTQDEIRAYLLKADKRAFLPETFVDFDHARRLVLTLGGIPSYPTLLDGATPLTQYEASPERLIAELQARGIPGAEFIPPRNAPDVLARYIRAMRAAGLFVTAGTEHNTLDLLPLAPACLSDAPIPDDIQDIFWEGACVVAAHQYLTLHGQPGFVDAEGNPNTVYVSDEARISAFSRLGAAIIVRFQQIHAALG